MPTLHVHFLPALVEPRQLAGSTVLVIDVLRATTTITAALAAGARQVIPCLEIDEARAAAARLPKGDVVLGGERGGVQIEGFDLGNSPGDYSSTAVGGKTVVFTTTNGTRAMNHARQAKRILLGAPVNLSAVCAELVRAERLDILCAGTGGAITREDVLMAGAVVRRLAGAARELNDQALLAADSWIAGVESQSVGIDARAALAAALKNTQGGRNLARLGLAADILATSQIDQYAIVPELDVARGRIVPSTQLSGSSARGPI